MSFDSISYVKGIIKVILTLSIDNFKSLVNFRADLSKFTCLIGLNGSGKSTILQAIDFITQLATGNLSAWLAARDWQPIDLLSHLKPPSPISFEVKLQLKQNRYLSTEAQVFRYLGCLRKT